MKRTSLVLLWLAAFPAFAQPSFAPASGEANALAGEIVDLVEPYREKPGDPGAIALLRLSAMGEWQRTCVRKVNGDKQRKCMRATMDASFGQAVSNAQVLIVQSTRAAIVEGYVETYSVDELNSLRTFLTTPLGHKLVQSQPVFAAKIADVRKKILLDAVDKWADAAGMAITTTDTSHE